MIMGAPELKKFIKDTLGIGPGETTADGKFHFSVAECQGACGGAPMIALNNVYHENLTVDKLDSIIKGCK
jgi:NADH-quinone oxidoreductase subunit E